MPSILKQKREPFDSGLVDLSKYSEEIVEGAKKQFLDFFDEIEKLDKKQSQVKFPALIPSEAKMFLPEKCHCQLFITNQESFILPDCTIAALKSRETFDWHGQEVNNIAMIGIPLSPKLYMEIWNSDVVDHENNKAYSPTTDKINEINKSLFNSCYTQVLLNKPEQLAVLEDVDNMC